MNNRYKVSVIVPIYNASAYLEKCVDSLMLQKLKDVEYIFINDASTDDSLSILSRMINKYPQRETKVISLDINGGISNARNIGLLNATGEYITHCDSDDWVEPDIYAKLYKLAIKNNADIVACDYIKEYENYSCYCHQPYTSNMEVNIKRLLVGDIFPSLWSSIIRRELIINNKLDFPNNLNMGEDLLFNIKAYSNANKIFHTDISLYHYRHSKNSVCVRRTRKSINSDITIAKQIELFLTEKGCKDQFLSEIQYRKFYSKLALIRDLNNKNNYREWLVIYPETHKYIMKFKKINIKFRLILWLLANKFFYVARIIQKLIEWQHELFKAVHRFFHLTSI